MTQHIPGLIAEGLLEGDPDETPDGSGSPALLA